MWKPRAPRIAERNGWAPVTARTAQWGKRSLHLTPLQSRLRPAIAAYSDVVFTLQTPENNVETRELCALHVANHVFKARQLVMEHDAAIKAAVAAAAARRKAIQDAQTKARLEGNARTGVQAAKGKSKSAGVAAEAAAAEQSAAKAKVLGSKARKRQREEARQQRIDRTIGDAPDIVEFKDQGYTRARVLVLVPFRSSALSFVRALMRLTPCKQVQNKRRFVAEFGASEDGADATAEATAGKAWLDVDTDDEGGDEGGSGGGGPTVKPRDYRQTFRGNVDDDFRVGISLSRKNVKLYSDFYNSDVIVASPLGLRLAMGDPEDKRKYDADFLSSIEIVVVDQADVLQWASIDRLRECLAALNAAPQQMRDTDFSRVRGFNLEGTAAAAQRRQMLWFMGHSDPEMMSLVRRTTSNASGGLLVRGEYAGTISRVIPQVRQVFQRIAASSASAQSDERFEVFRKTVLPRLLGEQAGALSSTGTQGHTLLFVPSHFDFLRLRRQLRKSEADFEPCSEYTEDSDISRSRSAFFAGQVQMLLYTERFHFYRRYRIRGIRHLVFYAPPAHAAFYAELLNLLQEASDDKHPVSCLVLFSRYDAMALERIVGTSRAARLLQDSDKTTFMFC